MAELVVSDPIPPANKHPTVGPNVIVDNQADQFLKSVLPPDWSCRKQSPDRFVDYHVEVVEKGEPTGFQFAIQLKGTAAGKRRQNCIVHRMRRKELSYYRDNARLPVFIVLVDVTKKAAYWLFAQQYLREHASAADLDNQNSLTLRFDSADCFSDFERFRNALKKAEQYVRDLHPGSPAAAISKRQKELQALDPEIGVNLSFTEGHEVLQLLPKKPFTLGLRTIAPEGPTAFQKMIDHGETFIAEVEVTPPDSPLLQKLMSNRKGLVHFVPDPHEGFIQMVCGVPTITIQINGSWRCGLRSIRFLASLDRSPLSIELKIEDVLGKPVTSFQTPLDLKKWEDQELRRLASFDQIETFVTTLATKQEFRGTYFFEGAKLGVFEATANPEKSILGLKNTIDWIGKCRYIAERYKINAKLPKLSEITYRQECEVEDLWALTKNGFAERSWAARPFGFSISPEAPVPENWRSTSPVVGALKFLGTERFDFFGNIIEVTDVENLWTDMELESIGTDSKSKTVEFRGRDHAVLTRRKLNLSASAA